MYLKLNTFEHMVVATPVARMLRRRTGDQSIFTYWHRLRKKWVCASWISKPGRVCHEHFIWEGSSGAIDDKKIQDFILTRSDSYRAFLKEMAVKARLYRKHDEDEAMEYAEEQTSLFDHCRRHARQTLQDHPSWRFYCSK